MAGTIMHLVVADRLLDVLHIKDPALFYCGNLAPDAIMSRRGYTREMKRHTHFKDDIRLHELCLPEKRAVYQERMRAFYESYVGTPSAHHELYLGYFTHMLVDELYILDFRDDYIRKLTGAGKAPDDEDFIRDYTEDVDLVDWELVRTYAFRYPMPETLYLKEPYEIPGYITCEELIASKEFIIKKNFLTPHEPKALHVMTFQHNQEFMDHCVEEIPRILKERY